MIEIYVLYDARDVVRYIGQSRNARRRFGWHLSAAKRGHLGRVYSWLRSELRNGRIPSLRIVEICNEGCADDRETEWIARYRSDGCDLTNRTDGGGGMRGWRHTAYSKKTIGDKHRGKSVSPATRAKLSMLAAMRRPSLETKKKMSRSSSRRVFGRVLDRDQRQQISMRMLGNKHALGAKRSADTIARMAFVQSGSRSDRASLTRWQVNEIRAMRLAGVKQVAIAKKLGVSTATISRVINGKTYRLDR